MELNKEWEVEALPGVCQGVPGADNVFVTPVAVEEVGFCHSTSNRPI